MSKMSKKTKARPAADVVMVECPLGEVPPHEYAQQHVEVQLNEPQAFALKRLVEGLDLAGARLNNERRITEPPDALRYLLERIDAAARNGS